MGYVGTKVTQNVVSTSEITDGTITNDDLASDIAISTSGSITTTGAFTSVGIDDNADATSITIDSDENVGIKTTTPSNQYADDLVVSVPDDGGITIQSGNTTHAGSFCFSDATTGSGTYAGFITYDHNTNSMLFGTNSGTKMTIDTDGNVTSPVSASMVAKKDGNQDCTTEATVTAYTEYFDEGSNFNNSTGIYTCPVDGKYLLHFSTLSDTNVTGSDGDGFAGNVHFSFNDGDNTVHYGYHQKSTSIRHDMFNLITIAEMSANDNIRVRATNTLVMDGVNTNFMVHLLGQEKNNGKI